LHTLIYCLKLIDYSMDKSTLFIKKFCEKESIKKHSDFEIVKMLLKYKIFDKYKEVWNQDSLRRKVSHIRKIYGLRGKADMTNFDKDMEGIINKYPDATYDALATKLQLQYPHLAISSIAYYLKSFKNYGIKRRTK